MRTAQKWAENGVSPRKPYRIRILYGFLGPGFGFSGGVFSWGGRSWFGAGNVIPRPAFFVAHWSIAVGLFVDGSFFRS
jgi:hypothetical protein